MPDPTTRTGAQRHPMKNNKSAITASGGRLKSGPAPELVRSANQLEVDYAEILHKGMSLADLAHVIMLSEAGIIPEAEAGRLLSVLVSVHNMPFKEFTFDPQIGDAYKNRERLITKLDPEVGGWLRTGRARREVTNIAYQIAVRERLLELMKALAGLADALVSLAEKHIQTVMPDFTYMQHAQPTTLAHYLLGFAHPILRDLDRLQNCFNRTNQCSGGIGSVNGSRLPFKRERLAELLGFDSPITHTRDAMWQADMPVEIMSCVVAAMINMDRLGEDLQVWVTQEFDLVDIADGYSRESVIMPQKKNPYSLAFIRGAAGVLIGQMTSMANVGRTMSGQPDSRIFAYGDVPKSIDLAHRSTQLMAGVIRTLSVNAVRMEAQAAEGYSQSTDLAELIMLEAHLPYLTAHRLVGEIVAGAVERNIPMRGITSKMIDAAARRVIGRRLSLPQKVLKRALQPEEIIATRNGLGGAAPVRVQGMIEELKGSMGKTMAWCSRKNKALAGAESRLLKLAQKMGS